MRDPKTREESMAAPPKTLSTFEAGAEVAAETEFERGEASVLAPEAELGTDAAFDQRLASAIDDDHGASDERPLDECHLWPQDVGTLTFEARSALLRLVRGPSLHETWDGRLWAALIANRRVIEERLADLFLELVVDPESGIAFARNARTGELETPKATRTVQMTLLDSIMVLTLRRELVTGGPGRVFIGQDELFESLSQYRDLERVDPSSYDARLKASWNRFVETRILLKTEAEGRFEISPVLKLVFGSEEAQAVEAAFERMAKETPLADDILRTEGTDPDRGEISVYERETRAERSAPKAKAKKKKRKKD